MHQGPIQTDSLGVEIFLNLGTQIRKLGTTFQFFRREFFYFLEVEGPTTTYRFMGKFPPFSPAGSTLPRGTSKEKIFRMDRKNYQGVQVNNTYEFTAHKKKTFKNTFTLRSKESAIDKSNSTIIERHFSELQF